MALTVFIIDYSGGTAGESHPVPFFQIQQVQGSVYRPLLSIEVHEIVSVAVSVEERLFISFFRRYIFSSTRV